MVDKEFENKLCDLEKKPDRELITYTVKTSDIGELARQVLALRRIDSENKLATKIVWLTWVVIFLTFLNLLVLGFQTWLILKK